MTRSGTLMKLNFAKTKNQTKFISRNRVYSIILKSTYFDYSKISCLFTQILFYHRRSFHQQVQLRMEVLKVLKALMLFHCFSRLNVLPSFIWSFFISFCCWSSVVVFVFSLHPSANHLSQVCTLCSFKNLNLQPWVH